METESSALPRFRTDLVAQPIDEEGQRFVDVTDPDSGATFRFYDVEYSIACAMDGRRDLDELVDYALEELGLEASPEELETVIGTLDELGYLELVSAKDIAGREEAVGVTDVTAGQDAEVDLAEGFELGAAGGTPEEAAAAASEADLEREDLELGAPGKSPIAAPRPEPPRAPELELGAAGTASPGEVEPPAAVRAITADLPEDEGEAAEEMSFAGLLDEDEAPTSVRVGPAGVQAEAAQAGAEASEDAPTTVRGDAQARPAAGVADFDEEEGLTPPPAAEPVPTLTPRGASDADYDGPTNLPPPQVPEYDDDDVSVDLSQHLSIDAEDVKEAVRASKVMDAVDVPDELLAEMEPKKEAEKKAEPEKEKEAEKKAEPEKEKPKKEPKPIELPEKPAKVAAKKKAAAAEELPDVAAREKAAEERKGTSPFLLVLFIIVLIGGAAAYYYLIYKPDHEQKRGTRPTATRKTGPGTGQPGSVKPQPPRVVSAKLAAVAPTEEVVSMAQDGVVAWMADADAAVAAGDRVAKLRDFDRWERKLREYKAREEHYQRKLDAANEKLEQSKAAGDEAGVKRYEGEVERYKAKVEEKQGLFGEAREALMQAELKAPVAGTVEQVVRAGAFVKAGAPVLKVKTAPGLGATFDLPAGEDAGAYPVDQEVVLRGKSDPNAELTCTVSASADSTVTVSCPVAGALGEGDEVVLK